MLCLLCLSGKYPAIMNSCRIVDVILTETGGHRQKTLLRMRELPYSHVTPEVKCVLFDSRIGNGWSSKSAKLCPVLLQTWWLVSENYSNYREFLPGWFKEWSTNKAVVETLQNWPKICRKWSTFWKAINKQNTRQCWTCENFSHWKSTIDSQRIKSWSWYPADKCVKDFVWRFWHDTRGDKISPVSSDPWPEEISSKNFKGNASSCYKWLEFPGTIKSWV